MLSDSTKEMLTQIPHHDMDVYDSTDQYEYDFRALFCGEYRDDTRSRVILDNQENVKLSLIRLPPVDNAEKQQDKILRIARRRFNEEAGCYGRSGNLHVKYPVTGELFNYTPSDFVEDYEGFKSEVEQKIDFK